MLNQLCSVCCSPVCDVANSGAGGFYSSGSADTYITPFAGAAGFRQGGAGAVPAYIYSYSSGGFGGGGTANYEGSCNSRAGPGKNINFVILFIIYIKLTKMAH